MITTHIIHDSRACAVAAAHAVTLILKQHKEKSILFLVSGGSTIPMVQTIPAHVFGPHITVGVLDERYSRDSAVNNYLQLTQSAIYKDMKRKQCVFINTFPEQKESMDQFVDIYEKALKDWRVQFPSGVIIITQGIGIDGHTVGIFPAPENPDWFTKTFDATDRWVVGYEASGKTQYPLRATTTFPFLRLVDYSIIYAYGEKKHEAIRRALAKTGRFTPPSAGLAETPARIIQEMKQIEVFTDVSL